MSDNELMKLTDGVYLAGRFSNWKVGSWVLQSGDECAVLEMPPPTFGQTHPAAIIKKAIKEYGWNCRYLFFSHPHWDHTASIAEYRESFPEAKFIAHYSAPLFLKMSEYYLTKGNFRLRKSPWNNVKEKSGLFWYIRNFNEIFETNSLKLEIGGEPLYLLYAPKHSLGDVHCIFKGVLFSGDWWFYEGDPCQDLAAATKAEESIIRLENFLNEKKYLVHSVFSAHADNLFYNIDLSQALKRTMEYHKDFNKNIKEYENWKNFDLKILYSYFFPDQI